MNPPKSKIKELNAPLGGLLRPAFGGLWESQNPFLFLKHKISYSNGIVNYLDGVVVKPDQVKITLATFKNLGTVRGFTPFEYLGEINSKKISLTESNSLESLLKLVLAGRIQGAYVNAEVARYFMHKTMKQENALVVAHDLPNSNSSYKVSTLKHPELLTKFNQWLEKNATIQKNLKKKWLIEDSQKEGTPSK